MEPAQIGIGGLFIMDIYISDKNKKEEVWKLRKYWEEKWFPAIKASLYNLCRYKWADRQRRIRRKPH